MDSRRWKQVDNLLQSVLRHRPEERNAFLCHACGVDKELENEVRSLLTSHQQAGRFLDGPAIEEAAWALLDQGLDQTCGQNTERPRQVEMLVTKEEHAGGVLQKPVLADLTTAMVARGSLVGREFGPYRILSLLGAGGMGEVYRAHDSKLGRDVAIKTLPYEFARDPDRLARFRREARTLASLNHPNIAAIYGLEESEAVDCLVLELVEGETLRGPLPLADALDSRGQVAEALEAAHEQGDHSPRPETGQCQGHAARHGEGAGFRLGESDLGKRRAITISRRHSGRPSHDHRRAHRRYARLHESGAGARRRRRSADRHLGFRMPVLRAAHRQTGLCRGTGIGTIAAVLDREPDWQALPRENPRENPRAVAAVSAEGRGPPAHRHSRTPAGRSRKHSVDGTAGKPSRSRRLRSALLACWHRPFGCVARLVRRIIRSGFSSQNSPIR